jgi:hypothetical protein
MWIFCLFLAIGAACGFRLTLLPFAVVSLFLFAALLCRAAATGAPFLFDACLAIVLLQIGYFGAVLIQALWRYLVQRGICSGW